VNLKIRREVHDRIVFCCKERQGVGRDNLQLKRKIHELEQKKEHARYHVQLGQEEHVAHQHSQQMEHRGTVGELLGETGAQGMGGNQQEKVVRNEESILKMMKILGMLIRGEYK